MRAIARHFATRCLVRVRPHAVALVRFRSIKSAVGARQAVFGVFAQAGDADAQRERPRARHRGVSNRERLHCCADPFHRLDRIRHALLGKDDQELFAAVAEDQVARANRLENGRRHSLQRDVAREVTVPVVVVLEVIDVAHRNGERAHVAGSVGGDPPQLLVERESVSEPGERVGPGDREGALAVAPELGVQVDEPLLCVNVTEAASNRTSSTSRFIGLVRKSSAPARIPSTSRAGPNAVIRIT